MLTNCFLHLPGIGSAFATRLQAAGVLTWDDALALPLPCGPARTGAIRAGLMESRSRLEAGDARWFGDALAPAEQWRLFPHFCDNAAYVDIETTGLAWPDCAITSIALYDGARVRVYVQGENLEAFADDILDYSLLVTWNGRGFDAPILRRSLHIPLDKGDMAHLDLLPVFRRLGLRGGLKKVEQSLGIDRGGLDGVDGWDAVRLWREYERSGDLRALHTLLAYNVADVLSLEYLAHYAVTHFIQGAAAAAALAPERVRHDLNPFSPDPAVLRLLRLA